VKGNWVNPYVSENQRDEGDYKMGVVTATNEVIIPVAYSKIYNPNGSFVGMIEVENEGLRGLFEISGKLFIPAEYDGIYPAPVDGAFAQLKKGESYGWADDDGKVSFDPASHKDTRLFQSPVESETILRWEFRYPGSITALIDPYLDYEEGSSLIIYPSFIRDFGLTGIANPWVSTDYSAYGMGTEETTIKFEKVEAVSDGFFGLIAFFMEAGADARGYHTSRNDLLIVDKSFNKVSHLEGLTTDYDGQDPCGEDIRPEYATIEKGLYESNDGHGEYKYYQVTAQGDVEELKSDRRFIFTKFANIDESYFNACRYEELDNVDWDNGGPNLVVLSGLSMGHLDLMRNEIFAECGFIFKSDKWKNYFAQKPWYKPQFENVDHLLTDKDKYNIKFILEYQRLHKDLEVQADSIRFMWAG
jgi:hypothetical protein